MSSYKTITEALQTLAIPENVTILQRFFKTGKGEYAEGDIFIGVKVPEQRSVAKAFYQQTAWNTLSQLLQSGIHEYRLTALLILTLQYAKAKKDFTIQKQIFDFYIDHRIYVNNWDLVDTSTSKIVGPYIHETQHFELLHQLAAEDSMWSKRIAVVALWSIWKYGYVEQGLDLISKNLQHPHDLMHKANGWMLRELGKYNEIKMLEFLEKNYDILPRTTLRYAIEKLDASTQKDILKGIFP
jgi:3-methyladenine DNA glycosylase AlkD